MENIGWILTAAVLLLFLLSILIPQLLRKRALTFLSAALLHQEHTAFDKRMQRKDMHWLFSPFQMDFMRLNKALAQGDCRQIDAAFERFDHCHLTPKQAQTVYDHGFYYYVSVQDAKRAKKYGRLYAELKNSDPQVRQEMRRYYDIFVNNSCAYIDMYERQLRDADAQARVRIRFLLAKMYENQGDLQKAKRLMRQGDDEHD